MPCSPPSAGLDGSWPEVTRVLSYSIVFPPGTAGRGYFSGRAAADGVSSPMVGDASMRLWEFPPPPLWTQMRWRPLSQMKILQIFGDRDAPIEIEASPDLRHWTTLGWATNSPGWAEWVIPDSPAQSQGFFRPKMTE